MNTLEYQVGPPLITLAEKAMRKHTGSGRGGEAFATV